MRFPNSSSHRLLAPVLCGLLGLALWACESKYSPTALDLEPKLSRVDYTLLVQPTFSGGQYPAALEVLLDGVVVPDARFVPQADASDYYYYGDIPVYRIEGHLSPLEPGRHILSIRVLQQGISPFTYMISGRVDLIWQYGNVSNAARWDQERVIVATGQSWSGEFDVPAL